MADNPFERYDLDPREGVAAITEALKERIEDAETDAERQAIRDAWQALTLHPRRRVELALQAHPETRAPLGRPPRPPRTRALPEVEAADLVSLPSVREALGLALELADVPLHEDPFLADPGEDPT